MCNFLALARATGERRHFELALQRSLPLGERIEDFWCQTAPAWREHRDINEAMLATRRLPQGFLPLPSLPRDDVRPQPSGARRPTAGE